MRRAVIALAFALAAPVCPAGAQNFVGGRLQAAMPDGVQITNVPTFLDNELAQARGGREFVASATMSGANPVVAAGSFLNIVVCNATGSGKLVTITERRLDGNVVSGQVPMVYGGIPSPAPIASPTVTTTGTNLYTGGPTSTAVTLTAAVSTTRLNNTAGNAIPSATGNIPVNGEPLKLVKPRIMPPGTCFGNFVIGQNQPSGLGSAAATANFTVYWTEEAM